MDYYRNLKLQLEAVTLLVATFSAQAGTLMAALTKPGTCTGTRASGTAPEAQHAVGGGENEEPFPSLPEPSQLPQPWALERPPCTLGQGGGREATGRRRAEAECGPHPGFRNPVEPLWRPGFQGQLALPLFQPARAVPSSRVLGGTKGSHKPVPAWAPHLGSPACSP